jgi:N utilization substance protein B
MSNRRAVRVTVLKSLYAYVQSDESISEVIEHVYKLTKIDKTDDYKFGERLLLKTVEMRDEADEVIVKFLKNWELKRLALIDRLILEMGITEMIVFPEIPTKVTINECIEIAKQYSTGGSGKFINGILDSALEHLTKENKIKKSGRGLIEESV